MAEKSKKPRKSKAEKAEAEAAAPATMPADEPAAVMAEEPLVVAGDQPGDATAGEPDGVTEAMDEPGPCALAVDDFERGAVTVDELVGGVQTAVVETLLADDDAAVAAAFAEEPVSAELKAIVEALVYASPDPLTPKALYKLLDSEPAEEVQRAIDALKQDYQQVRGLHLVEIAGGLQIVTRPDLNEWVRRLFHERKSTRLSVQALETLAVIAYRQPVTAAEITEIRGVNTSGVLSTLVERKLIKTAGRKAVVGRPFLYATTKEFLLRFGLNDVGDLPKVEDLADALGFELPGLLNEALPTDQMLPLGDPDEGMPAAEDAETASEAAAEPPSATAEEQAATDGMPVPDDQPTDEEPMIPELEAEEPLVSEPEPEPRDVPHEAPGLDEPIVPEPDPEP